MRELALPYPEKFCYLDLISLPSSFVQRYLISSDISIHKDGDIKKKFETEKSDFLLQKNFLWNSEQKRVWMCVQVRSSADCTLVPDTMLLSLSIRKNVIMGSF